MKIDKSDCRKKGVNITMTERIWTESQSDAIKSTGGAVLVSAAAGSGKTAVLVQRVIERITDKVNPVDADRLLVVTYTRAAAAEMKERINTGLTELINKEPFNSALRRQKLLLEKSNISTIHSFCNEIIKENFYALDISPNFRIAEDSELSIIKNDALNNVLDALYNEKDSDFINFTNAFSTAKNENNLTFAVFKLYDFLCSHPFSERWLCEKEQMYDFDCDISQTEWGKVILNYCADGVQFCKDLCMQSQDLYCDFSEEYIKIRDLISYDLNYISNLAEIIKEENWDKVSNMLSGFDFGLRFPALRGLDDSDKFIKDKIMSNRKNIKAVLQTMCKLFADDRKQCREEIYALSPIVRQLFKTVKLFSEEFKNLKKEKNVVDFSDLEHLTLNVLVEEKNDGFVFSDKAQEISKRFDEVMVDEYQDANEVQDLIFQAVSGKGERLFVVGDVKQSIYGFRQAMPEIFLRRKESYPLYDREKDTYPGKIILDKNFRSRRGITEAVNFVFKRLMSKEIGDMEYTDEEKLTPGADYPPSDTPDVAFHLLELGADEESDMDITEAHYIGRIIKQMLSTYKVTEGGKTRGARYSDFAVLLRNANTHSNVFVRELTNMGVPAACGASGGFLSSKEVAVVLSVLKVIDNPMQDIPLLTVLMSPVYGFTPDDMAQLRADHPKDNLYAAVKAFADAGNEKAANFLKEMDYYRKAAASNATDKLINIIYSRTGFTEMASAIDGGASAVNNLRLLLEHAKRYEQSGYKGLCGFIRFVDRLEEIGSDLPGAGNTQGERNCVNVMSIHRSKGLEFPVCFIASTSRKLNNDKRDEVLLHSELGLGIRYKDPKTGARFNTMPRSAVNLELEREGKSEELRVLYVAMTRAREKLFMISSHKNCEKYIRDTGAKLTAYDKISPYVVRGAVSMSNWITSCALLNPGGEQLRKIAEIEAPVLCGGDAPWDIKLINNVDDDGETAEDAEKNKNEMPVIDMEMLAARFEAKYRYKDLENIPVKVAVSQVAHESGEDTLTVMSHPAFLSGSNLTPAQKGTALHTFMQYADFYNTAQNPNKELERLVSEGFISREQAAAVDLNKIIKCINSPVMKRFFAAEKSYREYRFTVNVNSGIINENILKSAINEEIIMQGAVDCAFVENGEIVIVDYKTDKVKDINALKLRYKKQLELYRLAMEQTTGLKVKQCIIYSLFLDDIIEV